MISFTAPLFKKYLKSLFGLPIIPLAKRRAKKIICIENIDMILLKFNLVKLALKSKV